jgi:hypothetical protein
MTGNTSPFSGGLLAAKVGNTSMKHKIVIPDKDIKHFFIFQSPFITIFSGHLIRLHSPVPL